MSGDLVDVGDPADAATIAQLTQRLGRVHARQRLGIEHDHEAQIFGQGLNFFHIENWYSLHSLIRAALKLTGLYARGERNARAIQIRHNAVELAELPAVFSGFVILQLSDLHVDISGGAMERLMQILPQLEYDLCVLTGDFRGRTFGPVAPVLDGLARIRALIRTPAYGVLGNHDSIRMVPAMEEMGIRMLLNEAVTISRGGDSIHLVGIDDAHFFRVDNIEKALTGVPHDGISVLLSHTPEIYRQAAHAGFDLLLGGHTHGGQICLPGSIPIMLDSVLPRALGAGAWRYRDMLGYTSVGVGTSIVPVRLNCPPEITLHRLHAPRPVQ